MSIQILAPEAAARLAAGEVIERPASVVRELVDNAIDAGAGRITVRTAGGGLELIRVTDDGRGIRSEELPLAVQRHATSKLRSVEELPSIASLGFRGEALYAIGAVSRLRISSVPAGESVGREGIFEAGALVQARRWAGAPGTIVEVRDLFYNTPARLRFIKSAAAEASRIEQVLRRYAMGRPELVFQLENDGRNRAWNHGGGDLLSAVADVYGWSIGEQMLPVSGADGAVEVTGLAGAPTVGRSTRADIHIFVNGRWVVSRPLQYAVEEAYASLLMVGRFPLVVLHLRVPGDQLDVNVHPAKNEIRFADERGVARAVSRAVRVALLAGYTSVPAASPSASRGVLPQGQAYMDLRHDDSRSYPHAPFAGGQPQVDAPDGAVTARLAGLPPLRVLGQVARAFIVAEGPDGLCMIDQHAAHERVILERLQEQVEAQNVESQRLLEPEVVPLTPVQAAQVDDVLDHLRRLGFGAEPFGDGVILLRSVPAVLSAGRAAGVVDALTQGIEGLSTVDERQRAMLASLACHAAVRAGDALDPAEMRRLVEDLERTRVPTACAHGRPTILEFSTAQLEREFGRRGPLAATRAVQDSGA